MFLSPTKTPHRTNDYAHKHTYMHMHLSSVFVYLKARLREKKHNLKPKTKKTASNKKKGSSLTHFRINQSTILSQPAGNSSENEAPEWIEHKFQPKKNPPKREINS